MYDFGIRQAQSSYRIIYRQRGTDPNYCPGCGRSHWFVGRMTAECAFCATALPLEDGHALGSGTIRRRGKADIGEPHGRFTVNGGVV